MAAMHMILGSPVNWRAALEHEGEWTEEDYDALPEGLRAELHHGRLTLTPSATFIHNWAIQIFCEVLRRDQSRRKLVGTDTDVRMADGKVIYQPDVLVLREPDPGRPIVASNVILVGEFISPGGGNERTQKMLDYAEAGIPGYLIFTRSGDGYAATLYNLRDGSYEAGAKSEGGGVLSFEDPFHAVIDLRELEY